MGQLPDHIARRLEVERDRSVRAFQLRGVELREASDDAIHLEGYASVFGVGYEMYGGPPYGWTEYVDEGAFDKTLREKPDVQLLLNHAGLPLARTKSGTLRLSTDNVGLKVEADLDPSDPDVQRMKPKMTRGDLDEMSFAFRVMRQEWDEEYVERHLLEVSLHKGDVSVVNYGANDATSVSLRALAELETLDPEAVLAELRTRHSDPLAVLTSARDAIDSAIRAAVPTPEVVTPSLETLRRRHLHDLDSIA